MSIDITELTTEDRQKALMAMPIKTLKATLQKLMTDNRQTEIGVRLDALTIHALRMR